MKCKKIVAIILAVMCLWASLTTLSGCSPKKEMVVIYTSMESYRIEYLNERLREEFPQYRVIVEYMPTGNHAAKLLVEGAYSDCHITHNLEYGYLMQLDRDGLLADLSSYSQSEFTPDTYASANIIPQERNGGCIIVNTKLLEEKGLPEPTSYEDLLNPIYKNLISMPDPKASGTGYMFLKSLVNAWGEAQAFAYFEALDVNILQYTSSGTGPLNAVLQGEAAIGFGMTAPTVAQINQGQPLKILYFEEGSPYSMYGQSILKGKEASQAVQEVFAFLVNEFNEENCERFFPERLYINKTFSIQNYPEEIIYADMSGNTLEEKDRLLEAWPY